MAKETKIIRVNQARHMVITPKFRVSFPNVFVAKSFMNDPDQKKSFSVDMVFDSEEDFKKSYDGKKAKTPSMKKAVLNAKVDQWGEDKKKWPKFPHPLFKNGNERTNRDGEVYEGYQDKFFVTAKSGEKFPPRIIDKSGRELDEKTFYGGCFAQAHLLARPYIFGNNYGVRFILSQLMKVEDGERFGGFDSDVFDTVTSYDDEDDQGDNDSDEDEDDDSDF